MDNNTPIHITPTANGWIVRPFFDDGSPRYPVQTESYVFQSFAELTQWLGQHFSFRAEGLVFDALMPSRETQP